MKRETISKLLSVPVLALAASSLYSQSASELDVEDEEVFELSPFKVDGSSDNGYYATQTLAGTRIKTGVKDLSASLSIVTEDFLNDTNATDLQDVLIFQGNTEVSGITGNFSGSQGFGTGTVIGELARDNNSGGVTRVRGLAPADLTRDYFSTVIPFDSYNVDRVTVQRGANAVLFGLGSPGGLVNNNLLKARMDDYGRVRLRVDEFGSLRTDLRYNKELIEGKLSIVVAGLWDEEKFEQKEAWSRDQRIYANVLAQPFDETFSIRLGVEHGERTGAAPRSMPPGDMISQWYDYGKPIWDDPQDAANAYFDTAGLNGVANNRQIVGPAASLGATYFFLDPDSSEHTHAQRIYLPTAFVDNPAPDTAGTWYSTMLSFRPINHTRRYLGINPDGTEIPYPGSGGLYDQSTGVQITDRSIFDYRKHLLDGGLSEQFAEFDNYNVALEKTFWENRIALELAYNKEEFHDGQLNQLRGDPDGESLIIDINPYLGSSSPNIGTGGELIPNPNYGGIAVISRAENAAFWNDRESIRATGAFEFRSNDFLEEDSFFEQLFTRVGLTGVYQEREFKSETFYTRDSADISDMAGVIGSVDAWGSRVGQYHALKIAGLPEGRTLLDYNDISELSGINIQPINGSQVLPTSGSFYLFNTNTQSWGDYNINTYSAKRGDYENITFSGSKGKEKIESKVVNAMFYLWNDNIVIQRSWREDEVWDAGVSAPGRSDFSGLDDLNSPSYVLGDYGDPLGGQIRTWGIVAHTPEFIRDRFNGWDLSLHYGTGENFEPAAGRKNILNGDIPPVTGSTEEKGFTISSGDNMFIMKVNWFETGTLNASFDNGAFSAPEGILLNLARQLDNPSNVAQGFTAADSQAVLPQQSVIDLQGVTFDWANAEADSNPNPERSGSQDTVAEGVEIELFFNPTPNWTNILKVSRQETIIDNTAPVMRQWYQDFVVPNWINSDFAKNFYIDEASTTTLANQAQSAMGDIVEASIALDGSPAIEQREWSAILTSKYRFENLFGDFLENFEFGGTMRYVDDAVIGFAPTTDATGTVVRDIDSPYFADSETYLDLFINFDKRLWDQDMSFQLYVSDVTDHTGLVPVFANPDNSRTYRITEGRVISLSATLRF